MTTGTSGATPESPGSATGLTEPRGLRPQRAALGLLAFVLLGAIGVWAAGRLDPTGTLSLDSLLSVVPLRILILALGLIFLDYLMGGLRLHVWIRRLAPEAGPGAALRTYLVNIFAASISPLGSASGPAQIAVLARHGVPPSQSIAALLVNFIGLLGSFLVVGAIAGLYLAARTDLGEAATTLVAALLLVAVGAAALLGVVVGNPGVGARMAERMQRTGAGRGSRWLERTGTLLAEGVEDYRLAIRTLAVGWHRPFAIATSISALMLLNKCLVGYVLAVGMGFEGSYVEMAARQSLQWLLIYFSPSPGGSGIAEASVPAFLGGIVPAGRVLEYTVLWRFLTAFLGAILGALVAVRVFGRPGRRPTRGFAPR